MPRDSAWRDWYRSQHERKWRATGDEFEAYVSSALRLFHPDFINPTPAGRLGDGGCDGLAEGGSILYACYGSRQIRDAERTLRDKMQSDFNRGVASWNRFTEWRFVTNAQTGPLCAGYLISLQADYGVGSQREINCRVWELEVFWDQVVGRLSPAQLDNLFPGVPGGENVELEDLLPLLDVLGEGSNYVEEATEIRPVNSRKMDFNELPESKRLEFNEGRLMAPRISRWFDEQPHPELRDDQGRNFRTIYRRHREATEDPAEIIERIYVSLGGSNIRFDGKKSNAVYAVTSFFFDACNIFEEPPPDYLGNS